MCTLPRNHIYTALCRVSKPQLSSHSFVQSLEHVPSVYLPTHAVTVSTRLLTSPHFQIIPNPVNQANCSSGSCTCGESCVSLFNMLKTHVLMSLQLRVQTWGMQVLNNHSKNTHHFVYTLKESLSVCRCPSRNANNCMISL